MTRHPIRHGIFTFAIASLLTACGGGTSSSDSTAYTLGGTVNGLTTSGLVLANSTSTQAVASGATSFTFSDQMSGDYAVTVATQPDGQTCVATHASGSGGSAVTSVVVNCRSYAAFTSNLAGMGLAQFGVGSIGALVAQSPATLATSYSPSSLSTSADGKFAYVSFLDSSAIGIYTVSSTTGALTAFGSGTAQSAGYGLAISPNSKYLYVSNYGDASVSQFTIGSSGTLTAMSTASVAAGVNPYGVAVSPDGLYVYVANSSGNTISQYAVGSTGALAALTPASVSVTGSGTGPVNLAIDPSSKYVYVTLANSAKLAQFSIGTGGVLTSLSPTSVSTGTTPHAVVVGPGGRYVYVTNAGDNTVSQYSISSGKLTALPSATVTTGTNPRGISTSPSGSYVYVTNYSDATVSSYSVGSSGALTAVGTASTNGAGPTTVSVR
ncbi:beta-propeller fold lactonase family protein [Rhodoferax sp.]|uniref:lactonase family protein n=1 Tax=Rhodoferax sp. TaxID=50421 RepID=UPI0025DFB144|nr:beta-propeller fold lactonase family protein [Rhodoferax sp.]